MRVRIVRVGFVGMNVCVVAVCVPVASGVGFVLVIVLFTGMCSMRVRAVFLVNVFMRFVRSFFVVAVRTIFAVQMRVFFFMRVRAIFAVLIVMMFFGDCGNAPSDGGEEKCGNFEKIFLFHGNNIF